MAYSRGRSWIAPVAVAVTALVLGAYFFLPGGSSAQQGGPVTNITFIASTTSVSQGSNVMFIGVTTDANNDVVAGATINVYLTGSSTVLQTTTSLADGSYSVSIPFTIAGTFNLYAATGGVMSPPVTVMVAQVLNTIQITSPVSPITISVGTQAFSGIALDSAGNPVGALTITELLGQTTLGTTTTQSDGSFMFTVPFTTPGTYAIQVSGGGKTSNIITLNVTEPIVTITIAPIGPLNLTIPTGQTTIAQLFTGNALNAVGTGISGVPLYAFHNNILSTTPITTGAGGAYSVSISFGAGTFNIDVSANNLNNAPTSPPVMVVVMKQASGPNIITISSPSPPTIPGGNTVPLTATVTNSAGTPVAGDLVSFYQDANTTSPIATATTGATGVTPVVNPPLFYAGVHMIEGRDATSTGPSNIIAIDVSPGIAPPILPSTTLPRTGTVTMAIDGVGVGVALMFDLHLGSTLVHTFAVTTRTTTNTKANSEVVIDLGLATGLAAGTYFFRVFRSTTKLFDTPRLTLT